MVEILPFLEQQKTYARIVTGTTVEEAPELLFRPPTTFRCPRRTVLDQTPEDAMSPAHYVLVPASGRDSYHVFDAPVALDTPWITGPEISYSSVIRSTGPHWDGFFYARGFQQGVGFMLDGRDLR